MSIFQILWSNWKVNTLIEVMCSGGSKRKPFETGLIKGHDQYEKQEGLHHKISALLEFSATDDVMAFKYAVEKDGHDVDEVGLWYGRKVGSKEMCYEERTPLMIAAMYGSKGVLSYILGTGRVDVNQAYGSDKATPLHCVVAGGSASSPEILKLLLNASADVTCVDAKGNRPIDLIVSVTNNSIFYSRKRRLLAILEGANDLDEVVSTTPQSRIEKKAYQVDPSLPDMNSGIYSTNEFRMYTFKVKRCSRGDYHDWTKCPFAHPGETMRRRDPTKYLYSCVPCQKFQREACHKGDGCKYAHGIFESMLHPAKYRTQLCKNGTECTRRVCFFAHKDEELRSLFPSTVSALPSPTVSSKESSILGSPTMWQTQTYATVPTLEQLLVNRLKVALNAGDSDLDIGLLGLENLLIRKLMREEIFASQKQSTTGIHVHHNANQQLWGYASDQRYAPFLNRSKSFIEHGVVSSNSELNSPTTQVSVEASSSISARTEVPPNVDEPDVSWVDSLVKDDDPTMESDQYCVEDGGMNLI